jgi:hypothetical protein
LNRPEKVVTRVSDARADDRFDEVLALINSARLASRASGEYPAD